MKKRLTVVSIAFLMTICTSCQQRIFGIDQEVWSTLNEHEREKVIDGYNNRKEIALVNGQKREEKELENERHRQEIEAQTAPIYAIADAVSSVYRNCDKEIENFTRIQSISTKGKQKLLLRDIRFDVSPFSKMSDAWLKGQKVQLLKNEDDGLYSVTIKNLDNGECVNARKVKE